MLFTIRSNVFETNSSSQHTIAISNVGGRYDKRDIIDSIPRWLKVFEKDIWLDFSNDEVYEKYLVFGSAPFKVLTSFFEKMCYVMASYDDVWTDEQFDVFFNTIGKRHSCLKKYLSSMKLKEVGKDGVIHFNRDSKYKYGTVDHQSKHLLEYFLRYKNIDVYEFIESKEYIVFIDGDGSCISNSMLKSGILSTIDGNIYSYDDLIDKLSVGGECNE